MDWLHKIGPTQTNLFQVRSRGVRYLAGLRSETEAKRILSQLSIAVRRNAVYLHRGQRDAESWAAKLKANAPSVKQSNIPSMASALNIRDIE